MGGLKMENEEAIRLNAGKKNWSLLHYPSIEPLISVLEFGALKYAPNNWKKGQPIENLNNSIQRHLACIMEGEDLDMESNEYHYAHIMANCMFAIYQLDKKDVGS